MNVVVRRMLAMLGVVGALALSMIAMAAPAHAVDNYPCGAQWWHSGVGQYVQYCPDWAPDNQIPVLNSSWGVEGYINAPGNDWYVCQSVGGTYTLGSYSNDKWAWTMADNGRWGWVSEVYFRGGNNFEADAGLRWC